MAETVEESYETVTRKVVRKSIKIEEVSSNRNIYFALNGHVPLVKIIITGLCKHYHAGVWISILEDISGASFIFLWRIQQK